MRQVFIVTSSLVNRAAAPGETMIELSPVLSSTNINAAPVYDEASVVIIGFTLAAFHVSNASFPKSSAPNRLMMDTFAPSFPAATA